MLKKIVFVLFYAPFFSFSMDSVWGIVGAAKRSLENKAYGHLSMALSKIESGNFDIDNIDFQHDLERGIQEAVNNSKFNELFRVVNFCVEKDVKLNPYLYSKAIDALGRFREERMNKFAELLKIEIEMVDSMVKKEVALRRKIGQFPSPDLEAMNSEIILKLMAKKANISLSSDEAASSSKNPFDTL